MRVAKHAQFGLESQVAFFGRYGEGKTVGHPDKDKGVSYDGL